MMKLLTDKLSIWKVDGKSETKADLYEIIETLEALTRAQFMNITKGMSTEEGAKKVSETAMAGVSAING